MQTVNSALQDCRKQSYVPPNLLGATTWTIRSVAATISGYLGKGDTFYEPMGHYALAFADRSQEDYMAPVNAIHSGRVKAVSEE